MSIKSLFKGVCTTLAKHSPEILTGLGLAGMLSAIVLAVKATPKAEELIAERKDELEVDELTPAETVKAAWKPYIPAAATCVASMTCIIGASGIHYKRNAALASAYAFVDTSLKKYQDKTAEMIGEEKEQEIRAAVAKDEIKQHPAPKVETIMSDQNGQSLFRYYDPLSDRYFYANDNIMTRVELNLNKRLYSGQETYVTVNDLYDELTEQGVYPKLKHTSTGSLLGWDIEHGGIEFWLTADRDEEGTPCGVMGFSRHKEPRYVEHYH